MLEGRYSFWIRLLSQSRGHIRMFGVWMETAIVAKGEGRGSVPLTKILWVGGENAAEISREGIRKNAENLLYRITFGRESTAGRTRSVNTTKSFSQKWDEVGGPGLPEAGEEG